MANKRELRKVYQKKRMALSADSYNMLNKQLFSQFAQIDFSAINCIHLFLPIREKREPDTFILINWLKQNHGAIKRVYPKTNFANNTLQHFADDYHLQLATNPFGIPEPVAGNEIDIAEIDIVLVPLLCFDKRGNRVGYGQGFYDRFLAQCKPGTRFIGLSLFEPVDSIADVDRHDKTMHQCITPQKIWTF